ncbi:MAG: RNA polymerase sigma factor [Candidatus Buchananbacteria bacterium]|nr:RNA polymerase sigma factor [Candidatus Buchananbacteria bacterium]
MSLSLKEKLLLVRLKKKDKDAFGELYDLYVASIYRFIFFKVPTRQDAEDLTSETFLKIWNYVAETQEEVKNLKSLLYTTARNLVVDFYRKKSQVQLVGDEETLLKIEDSRQQNILSQIDIKAEVNNIEEIIKGLKDEYREVIVMRYVEQLSITEIAEVLNKSKGSVRVLVHRALKVVKETIEKNV